jgi:L-gulonolactone oxidase
MQISNFEWQNWFGNLHSTVDLYQPSSLAELSAAVKRAAQKGRVRPVGGSAAWSPLVPGGSSIISLSKLRRVHAIERDGASPTIRVECGWPVRKLVDYTAQRGLTLITPPIFEEITLGGALAVGAHGTGLGWSTMSDTISELRLVDHHGKVIELTEARDGDLFDAARTALGTFGVLYDVTLRCEHEFNVHVEDRFKPREEVLSGIDDLLATYEFVELYWFPFTDYFWIKVMSRTDERVPKDRWRDRLADGFNYALTMAGGHLMPLLARNAPELTPLVEKLEPRLAMTPGTRIETASEAFHYQRAYPRCWDMSYAVPLADSARAWRATMKLIEDFGREGKYPVNMVVHSRFIGASRGWLAPAYGQPMCDLEVTTIKGTPNTDEFFTAFTDTMLAFPEARPHWGKYLLRPQLVRDRYPKMDAFLAHRARFDPEGVFLNDFLAREIFQLHNGAQPRKRWDGPRVAV